MRYKNILFLCTGNSCRSPMAEGLLKRKMKNKNVTIHSAGTHAIEGVSASENSIAVMREDRIDIANHKAQFLNEELVKEADLIFAMAPEHINYVRYSYPKYYDKIYLLKRFGRERENLDDDTIHDPIGGDKDQYRICFKILKFEANRISELLFEE